MCNLSSNNNDNIGDVQWRIPTVPRTPLSFHFRREAQIHFAMQHDNIVRVLAFCEGSTQRAPFLVMERMEESLSSLLRVVKGPLPIGDRLEIIKDICQVWYSEERVPQPYNRF